MYKSFVLLTISCLFSLTPHAQKLEDKICVLHSDVGSSVELLQEIEAATDVIFSYSTKICLSDSVFLSSTHNSIKGFLSEIFSSCPVQIEIKGNKILLAPLQTQHLPVVLKGTVRSYSNHLPLVSVTVFFPELQLGTVTNSIGEYQIELPKGGHFIKFSYVGYNSVVNQINLKSDSVINVDMHLQSELSTVDVMGYHFFNAVGSAQTGRIDLPVSQIRSMPAFLGEMDVVKSIQLLPGIQSGSEGLSGIYVRGGSADQNLVLMDDIPLYNTSHLYGLFSVFNSSILDKVTVVKGAFSSRFGGRLSSVVDVKTIEGDNDKLGGSASVGVLSADATLNGPIIKDKLTFSISGRRTYIDLLAMPFEKIREENGDLFFYDINGKINYSISSKSKLMFTTYWGEDKYVNRYNYEEIISSSASQSSVHEGLRDESVTGWGNFIAALKWTQILGDNLVFNTNISYNNYRYFITLQENYQSEGVVKKLDQKYYSGIRDYSMKSDFDYSAFENHHLKFGAQYQLHQFTPGVDVVEQSSDGVIELDETIGEGGINGRELSVYLEDDFKINHRLRVNAGVRNTMFFSSSVIQNSIEPRLAIRCLLNSKASLKFAYSRNAQFIHLVSTSNISMPTDLWLPVTDQIKPSFADQLAVSANLEVNRHFDFTVEGYFKMLQGILDYKENNTFYDFSTDWFDKFTVGRGTAYGVEFLLQKREGRVNGWLGYTLSKSTQVFDDKSKGTINNGESFPSRFDRLHDLSVFVNYQMNDHISGSLTWVYSSGLPVTLPVKKYYTPSLPTDFNQTDSGTGVIELRNGYRLPVYHRMDIGFNFTKEKKWGERIWSLGVYNLYGRQNAMFLYFSSAGNTDVMERELKQFSVIPFPIPYVRYTAKF